jgi:hypothetical protein
VRRRHCRSQIRCQNDKWTGSKIPERGCRTNVSGRRPEVFGAPPASTEPGYQACISGLRWVASAILRSFQLQPHPKGRRHFPLFAITQARNTSAIIAAMTPRGCREPCFRCSAREIDPSLPHRPWPRRASLCPLYY